MGALINTLAVSGHRSLRELVLPLDQLNLVTGANGTVVAGATLFNVSKWEWPKASGKLIRSAQEQLVVMLMMRSC